MINSLESLKYCFFLFQWGINDNTINSTINPIYVILNGEKLKAFPLRSGKRQGWLLLPLILNTVLEVLAIVIRKEIKGIHIEKTEVRPSLFDMMLYIENPKDSTKKLLELINKFSKVTGPKLNIKNLLHFYTIMHYQKEQSRSSLITIIWQRIKCLGINLTKKIKDLHLEKL